MVKLPRGQLLVFVFPNHLVKLRPIAQAAAGLPGQVHVDAGEVSCFVQVAVWLIVVAADAQDRQLLFLLLRHRGMAASGQGKTQRQRQGGCDPSYSHGLLLRFSRSIGSGFDPRQGKVQAVFLKNPGG